MNYHIVTDEWWMNEKDAIVDTMAEYSNNVIQPITQRQCFIIAMRMQLNTRHIKMMEFSFIERKLTRRSEYQELHRLNLDDLHTIVNVEHEIKKAYDHMFVMSSRIQEHYFDLVGIGYGSKDPRLTADDIKILDARWYAAHPDEVCND